MAWLAVDGCGREYVYDVPVKRLLVDKEWYPIQVEGWFNFVELPIGSIEKLIGRRLTWDDEPVEVV